MNAESSKNQIQVFTSIVNLTVTDTKHDFRISKQMQNLCRRWRQHCNPQLNNGSVRKNSPKIIYETSNVYAIIVNNKKKKRQRSWQEQV